MSSDRELRERYETLDVLRGIAAFCVLFWHWRWLYCTPPLDCSTDPTLQPFFWLLKPLYQYGRWGVDLFFLISGFVFFYLYADAISNKRVMGVTFAVSRFSRLYPLHLLTLLVVTALQMLYFQRNGSYFIFEVNDAKHFLMHLFFASNWSRNSPFTFNGPAWSLSIEVLLYAMFFVLARTRLTHPLMLAVMALGGAFITREYNWIGRGVLSFFTGGLCFYLTRDWRKTHRLDPFLTACALLVPVGALLIQIVRKDVSFAERFTVIVLFPAMILTLTTNEIRLKPIIGPLRWLGDISYSSYLIHFPLALSFVTAASYFGFVMDPSSPWSLLLFLAFLIVLSILSFSHFETPVQGFLRTIAVARFNAHSQKTDSG